MSKVEQKIKNKGFNIEPVFGRNKKFELTIVGYVATRIWFNEGVKIVRGKNLSEIARKV